MRRERASLFGFFRKSLKIYESFDEIGSKKIDPPTLAIGWKICALECIHFLFCK
jgi:hypothetical protein